MALILPFVLVINSVQSMSSCIKSGDIVTNYSLSNLINDGWTRCYFKPFSISVTIQDFLNDCPMGDNYFLFIGATESSISTEANLGAFAPSEVLLVILNFYTINSIIYI